MSFFKDNYTSSFETNPWLKAKHKLIRLITSPYRIFRTVFLVTGAIFWGMVAIAGITLILLMDNLPTFNEGGFSNIKEAAQKRVQSKLNTQSKLSWTPIDQVNRELLYAIVMSEDGEFFVHQGVDYDALINAIGENIKRRKWSFGASTISQQTIKNIYLSETKTLYRKLKELISTRRLEKNFSKNQILELYLNVIEFGPDIYGISAAANYYFDKKPSQLNAAQGAFLALILPSPRKYHFTIFQNEHMSNRHKRKYKRILHDMRFKEYISPRQYNSYIKWDFF